MRTSDLDLIRSLPLFHAMSGENFEALTRTAIFQRFPPHVVLIEEGHLPDFLHVAVEGTVELYSIHGGSETSIDLIEPVRTFILAAVVRDELYLNSARTLTDARILMLPANDVREIFGRDAAFARAVVNELADRYRAVIRSLKNVKLRTSAERLANWILKAADPQSGNRVTFGIEKRRIASQLGMTPENLSRNLSLLTEHGVRANGRDLIVEDREALAAFAQPTPLIDG